MQEVCHSTISSPYNVIRNFNDLVHLAFILTGLYRLLSRDVVFHRLVRVATDKGLAMAYSRNERRRIAKLRRARRETNASNSAAVQARADKVRDNLSHAIRRDNSRGLVTDYSSIAYPIGKFERRFTKGAANAGTSGGLPV